MRPFYCIIILIQQKATSSSSKLRGFKLKKNKYFMCFPPRKTLCDKI